MYYIYIDKYHIYIDKYYAYIMFYTYLFIYTRYEQEEQNAQQVIP